MSDLTINSNARLHKKKLKNIRDAQNNEIQTIKNQHTKNMDKSTKSMTPFYLKYYCFFHRLALFHLFHGTQK